MHSPAHTDAHLAGAADSAVDLPSFYLKDILRTAEQLRGTLSEDYESSSSTSKLPITKSLPTFPPITEIFITPLPPHIDSRSSSVADKDSRRPHLSKTRGYQQTLSPFPPPRVNVTLPTPSSITNDLLQTGLDNETIDKISKTYVHRAHELLEKLESSLHQSCINLSKIKDSSFSDTLKIRTQLCKTASDIYLRQLESWKTVLIQRGLDTPSVLRRTQSQGATKSSQQPKPAFNHVRHIYAFIDFAKYTSSIMFHSSNSTSQITLFQHTLTRISLRRSVT